MDGWAIVGPGKPLKLKYFVVGAFRYAPKQDLNEPSASLPEPKPEAEIPWEEPEKVSERRRGRSIKSISRVRQPRRC